MGKLEKISPLNRGIIIDGKRLLAILTVAGTITTGLITTGCKPKVAEASELTPKTKIETTHTPSPTTTPIVITTPEAEELRLLNITRDKKDKIFIADIFAVVYTTKDGEKRIAWTYINWEDSNDYFIWAFNNTVMFTANDEYINKMIGKNIDSDIVSNEILERCKVNKVVPLLYLPEILKDLSVEAPNIAAFNNYMNIIKSKGEMSYGEVEMTIGDLANFYIAATPKQYRVPASEYMSKEEMEKSEINAKNEIAETTPKPVLELSREEELKLLNITHDKNLNIPVSYIITFFYTTRDGDKRIAWLRVGSVKSNVYSFMSIFNDTILFDIKGKVMDVEDINEWLDLGINPSETLKGSRVYKVSGIYRLREDMESLGMEVPTSPEFNHYMDIVSSTGSEDFAKLEMSLGDLANFYIAATPKEYRVPASEYDPEYVAPTIGPTRAIQQMPPMSYLLGKTNEKDAFEMMNKFNRPKVKKIGSKL